MKLYDSCYMLGLDKSPDGKENVYKINIDLQVEKEKPSWEEID